MDTLNRNINKLFQKIAHQIYESDLRHGDTQDWWPIRPTRIDWPLAPFLFSELIRLFKKADQKNISLPEVFNSSDEVWDLQFLWTSLGWKPTEISYEDKYYLIGKFLEILDNAPAGKDFVETFTLLGQKVKEAGEESKEKILQMGTEVYMSYLKKLYEVLGEDWEKALAAAKEVVVSKQEEVRDPGPWGNNTKVKAIRQLVRNSDFRREKEKDLEEILQGVPEVAGIVEGVVGANIIVTFSLEELIPEADAFVTDIDVFNKLPIREHLEKEGIVVISKTRSGSHKFKDGDKVWVDGTSGIIFKAG